MNAQVASTLRRDVAPRLRHEADNGGVAEGEAGYFNKGPRACAWGSIYDSEKNTTS